MTALLWDLDGTLIDSVGDIAAAVDGMLAEAGLPALGVERVREFVGDGASKLVDRCVTAAGGAPTRAHLDGFLLRYRATPVAFTTVYPGIADLLRDVRWPQAVVTNKPEGITREILAHFGLPFAVVVGGDTLPTRKPDAAPVLHAMRALGCSDAVLVGDGPADVGAARAAGIRMVGVTWGIGTPAGAPILRGDVAALRAWLVDAGALG